MPRTQWALWLVVACAPFATVIAVRSLAGVGGPQQAQAAADTDVDITDAPDETKDLANATRRWVVPGSDAGTLEAASAEQLKGWTAPLFPVKVEAPERTDDGPSMVPPPAPVPASAARFADMFRVTSLMTTRDGPVAVIDKKLRRVGDELGEGVMVETIDLAGRIVMLRTADGFGFERRASR